MQRGIRNLLKIKNFNHLVKKTMICKGVIFQTLCFTYSSRISFIKFLFHIFQNILWCRKIEKIKNPTDYF